MTGINRTSVNQWYRYARDICSCKICEDDDMFLFGGENRKVEIDESVIARRKYNRGRRVVLRWVLGIYDPVTKTGLVQYVKKRDAATLLPIIEKHVQKGTEICTDEWRAYSPSALGYIHKTVNHSKHFTDPISKVCTNRVEGFWGSMKKGLRKKGVMGSIHINEHVDEFMWRRTYVTKNVNAFDKILEHISDKYKK